MNQPAVISARPGKKAPHEARRPGEHRQSAEVRERILDATLEVARESGYRGLTIARVSAASGYPSGSVYWHFENKDGLLRAALEISFERQHDAFETFAPREGETAHEYVDRSFDNIRGSQEPWEFWRIGVTLISDEMAPEKLTLQRFREIRVEARAMYARWWAAVLPRTTGSVPGHTPEDFADLMLVIHDGFDVSLASGDSSGRQIDVFAAAFHAMVDVVERAAT